MPPRPSPKSDTAELSQPLSLIVCEWDIALLEGWYIK